MLFCGVYIDPQGEIHESLLIGFGEVATFAGALFGIDAAYAKKLWDITNSSAKNRKAKPYTERSISPQETPSSGDVCDRRCRYPRPLEERLDDPG